MALIIPRHLRYQRTLTAYDRRRRKSRTPSQSLAAYSLRTSWVGGFGILILTLLGLIPPPNDIPSLSLAILVVPGFLMVCICTGLLACIDADIYLENNLQSTQLGWMAGYWLGVFGGIVAMVMAAIGIYMPEFGHAVVRQFTDEQLNWLASCRVGVETVALAGRVLGAMICYGFVGSLIAGLCGALGGLLYPIEKR